MIMKTFTAGVLAVSLTLTSLTPTTATADVSNEDVVAGAFALLLLGAAIHNSNGRSDDRRTARPSHPPRGWRNLSSECLRGVNLRNGNRVEMLNRRCINRTYAYADRLPRACHTQVRAANGETRAGYRVGCLRDQGFRITRR